MTGPRTPLLKPREYFASKTPPLDLGRAVVAVAVVTLVLAAGIGGLLWTFTQQLDQQVTVDNPEHHPEWACEKYEDGGPFDDMSPPEGCDPSVPEEMQRPLGELIWEEFSWVPWATLVLVPLTWLFEGAMLHIGSSLVGGEGRFTDTLAVAGWGMVPTAVRTLAVGSYLIYRLGSLSLPSSPEAAVQAVQTAVSGLGPISGAVMLVVVAWATYIRTYGLARARDLPVGTAAVVTVGLTAVGLLFELV
ncbi:Yip1 family protein [Haloferax larsenii]|uniref:Yip1 domain-containing protein n=1 Tax=Haloferax larsenii TaxID=302484 RepID=A0A1H7GEE2_HALLR|nr:Yip1 family protein [Haloferax larsenii]SEK36491.1 Yip1 domain-containing protein [Haloferax larsenii]